MSKCPLFYCFFYNKMISYWCDSMNRIERIFVIGILLLCSACTFDVKDKPKTTYDDTEVIDSIIKYNNDLDKEFLKYIYDEYGRDSLIEVEEALINNTYTEDIWHKVTGKSYIVLNDLYNNEYDDMDNVKMIDIEGNINISFVGDISLADNFEIMPYYDSRNEGVFGILSTEVVDKMKSSSIMVANNEFAITNSNNKISKLYNFKANPERINIYKEMGVDLVSLANNHVYDYGEEGLLDTIRHLNEYEIPNIGAGSNISEAKEAYYFVVGGYKFSFISATRAEKNVVTPNAEDDKPGVFWCYDPSLLIDSIKEEKEVSDFVIVLIHWGREDSHELEDVQKDTARMYIDAGADFIIGSHAHMLQGFEFYNNKLIAYNLGDFIFNRETKDTGILSISIDNDKKIGYQFIPCRQDNYKTSMLYDDEKIRVLDDMRRYSINTTILDDGVFY